MNFVDERVRVRRCQNLGEVDDMTVRYAVTFEFEMKPPLTHRGVAEGSSAATVVKRALKSAMAAYPRVVWSSMNIVLLERLDAADAPAA